jgi:hypothetical protein
MTALALTGVAYAEVICGQWAARCPRRDCANCMPLDAGQDTFVCDSLGGCGFVAEAVVWPPDPDAIEALLMMRPVFTTRNYVLGETLEDLLAENAEHAVLPPEWSAGLEAGDQRVVADIIGQRVVGGLLLERLTAADPQRAIGVC